MNAVILGFGPQPLDFFKHASKACGKDSVIAPDIARMAGASIAAGTPEALEQLRARLAAGALEAQKATTPGLSEAAVRWLAHGRRGISSNTMFSVMTGVDALDNWRRDHPHDPDDFNRCLQLLDDVPELRAKLPLMAKVSRVWAALVDRWDEIERSHLEEVGLGWTKADSAPLTYALMRSVIDAAEGRA